MKQGSTLILKSAVLVIGLIVLALCIFALPTGIKTTHVEGYRPILLGMYVTVVPFFIALYHSLKLLSYIDNNKAFSDISVRALNSIKYSALIICGLYAAGMPYIYMVAEQDDAPGVILIGLVFVGTSLLVAVFAAVLQHLLKSAIDIKKENDLTV